MSGGNGSTLHAVSHNLCSHICGVYFSQNSILQSLFSILLTWPLKLSTSDLKSSRIKIWILSQNCQLTLEWYNTLYTRRSQQRLKNHYYFVLSFLVQFSSVQFYYSLKKLQLPLLAYSTASRGRQRTLEHKVIQQEKIKKRKKRKKENRSIYKRYRNEL